MQLAQLADFLRDGERRLGARPPKYLRLSEGILRAIESGQLQTGDRLPGESEMAAKLPASLGTVQKALAHLAKEGRVVRRHGAGTFVARPPSQLHGLLHFRFVDNDTHALLPVYTRVAAIRRVTDPGPWADFLGEEPFFVRIDRQIDVNREFPVLARIFLSGSRFGEIANWQPRELDNVNFRLVLSERFDAPTVRIVEEIGAETLADGICTALGLAPASVGMVCHVYGSGYRDTPLYYQAVHIPPNSRRLEIRPRVG